MIPQEYQSSVPTLEKMFEFSAKSPPLILTAVKSNWAWLAQFLFFLCACLKGFKRWWEHLQTGCCAANDNRIRIPYFFRTQIPVVFVSGYVKEGWNKGVNVQQITMLMEAS